MAFIKKVFHTFIVPKTKSPFLKEEQFSFPKMRFPMANQSLYAFTMRYASNPSVSFAEEMLRDAYDTKMTLQHPCNKLFSGGLDHIRLVISDEVEERLGKDSPRCILESEIVGIKDVWELLAMLWESPMIFI